MPLPQDQVGVYLNLLRQKGAESRAAYNVEFQAAKDWVNAALEEAISNKNAQPPKVHAPKTPVGKAKVALAALSDSEGCGASCSGSSLDQSILEASRPQQAPLPDYGLDDLHSDDSSGEENKVLPCRKRARGASQY